MAKVLIADDQPHLRQLVRLTLESGRFEIFEAPDGEVALDVARREHPDLLFREIARAMGVDDYITKPFSPIELLEKVREVLGPEALL